MAKYFNKKRLIRYIILIIIAVLIIYFMGWEEEGALKHKIRYIIRALT